MAKKTKDLEVKESNTTQKAIKPTSSSKKASKSKKTTIASKKAVNTKSESKNKSTTSSKKTSSIKKSTSVSKKSSTTRKAVSRKKTTNVKKAVTSFKSEYYDLPYEYNKTVVKVLAQTPKTLFIYWEIAEADRKHLKETYGENFFEVTKPILIVYNDTLGYSFEVEINDFANSWYLNINDANCDYRIELGRKPIPNISSNLYMQNNNTENNEKLNTTYIPYYIYVTSSNKMSAPNNKILFNPELKALQFRNIKTGQVIEKDITQFKFITNFGIFDIKQLYQHLYPNENFNYENFFSGNPSSGLPSSGVFSSQFK